MRSFSDCLHDMLRTRTEDRKVEALLSRRVGDDPEGLGSLLITLDPDRLNISVEERASDFAANASRLVRLAEPVTPIRSPRRRLVPRLATVGLSTALVMGLLTGVALAADGSRPGDALYGLDRALENIGINDGGIAERLDEAQALADDGQTAEALAHMADALGETSPNVANALENAAGRFEPHDNPSQSVREGVADMLEWMARTEASGRDFGQGVAERARALGAGHSNNPATNSDNAASEEKGPNERSEDGANNANDASNKPDDPGTSGTDASNKPDDPGADGTDGADDNTGNSDNSGGSGNNGGGGENKGHVGGNGNESGPPGGSPPGKKGP
jgi:hypothetical protein